MPAKEIDCHPTLGPKIFLSSPDLGTRLELTLSDAGELEIGGKIMMTGGDPAGGDLDGSTFPSPVIKANAITMSKLADMVANTILARAAATTGDPAAVAIGVDQLLARWSGDLIATDIKDEDNMASDSDEALATQQSIKKYVDDKVVSSVDYLGGYNAATNTPDLDTSPSGVLKGDMYTVTAAGTFFTITVEIGDVLIAEIDSATVEADWTIVQKNLDAPSIKTAYESNSDTNAYTDAEKTKLTNIEALAKDDQSNAEIETAYNAQVAAASQVEAEAGTETEIRRFSPLRIKQAHDAFGGGLSVQTLTGGRLTLETGVPVSTSDQLAKTTLYYTQHLHNVISIFDGSAWQEFATAEISVAVPATTVTPFDVFIYDDAGTRKLETLDWTNDTTRATAIVLQDGVYVKSGATTRKYLGTCRTTGVSGQCEDSEENRLVWNHYNKVPRKLKKRDTNTDWTYATATWRQARGDADNDVGLVVGVVGAWLSLHNRFMIFQDTAGERASCGIAEDATNRTDSDTHGQCFAGGNAIFEVNATLEKYPAIGYHYYAMTEWAESATATFYNNHTGPDYRIKSGLTGSIMG